ncbi:glycosyltransferase family 4 protein [Lactococcus ileimucosae]|uniref:Glycosyltransferase family 4 protein n=1 Tax=Lactococcus ileimucosae TaxID=2941329 RepID=A0ABV4D6W9_9LACT
MRIGIFTDSYFPQISGVATSIQSLTIELEKLGHQVFIFTTTDPHADVDHEPENIIRFQSVPFVSLAERKVVIKGVFAAYQIARTYQLDIIHTQTEFGMGLLGKMVAQQLQIPVIHTLHTKYEDYVHYIAKGRLIRPSMVKYIIRNFLRGSEAIICPSQMVLDTVNSYGISLPKRVIPTGIDLSRFKRDEITLDEIQDLRHSLGLADNETMLLSLSRVAAEKNIQAVVASMPQLIEKIAIKLVIVGDGPYMKNLQEQVAELNIGDYVVFTGAVENKKTAYYYKAADFFISASTSETQGLTYLEALAAGTRVLATVNPYLTQLIDAKEFGRLFASDEDIADTVLAAVNESQELNKEKFNKKLYEISAENFAQQVYNFYQDTIVEYQARKNSEHFLDEFDIAAQKWSRQMKRSFHREKIRARYLTRKATKLAKNLQNYVKIDKENMK